MSNNKITDKTMCLLTKDGIKIWITQKQADDICRMIENKQTIFSIDKEIIFVSSISGIYSSEKIEDLIKIKKGMWQCEYCDRWHDKFEQCGCQGGKY